MVETALELSGHSHNYCATNVFINLIEPVESTCNISDLPLFSHVHKIYNRQLLCVSVANTGSQGKLEFFFQSSEMLFLLHKNTSYSKTK